MKIGKKEFKFNFSEHWWIIILLGVAISFLVTNGQLTQGLKSLPTCLYGCDFYYEQGIAMDIMNNPANSWQSSTHDWLGPNTNSIPKSAFYLRALVQVFSPYDYFNSWKTLITLSYFLVLVGVAGWFLLYNKMFGNKLLSIFLTVISFSLLDLPYFKGRAILNVIFPYLFLLYIQILEDDKINLKTFLYSILTIAVIVFISNAHAMGFFLCYFFLGFGYLFFSFKSIKPKQWLKTLKTRVFRNKTIVFFFIIKISIGLNFLLGWWYYTIFVHGGAENAERFDVHVPLTNTSAFLSRTLGAVQHLFLRFDSFTTGFLSIMSILGVAAMFFLKTKSTRVRYIRWIFYAFLFSVFNYVITVPLLGKNLSPAHALDLLGVFFTACLFALVFFSARSIFKYPRIAEMAVLLLLIVAFTSLNVHAIKVKRSNDKFWTNGARELPAYYLGLQDWYKQNNINPSDTILISTNELSFASHGVTGCKLLAGRQSHFFFYGDFQRYWLDSAVILYSNSAEVRKNLLQHYVDLASKTGKTLYLYWDYYWINSEYTSDGQGGYRPFDPLRFEHTPQREKVLKTNGIKFALQQDAIFEPSAQNNPYAQRLDILYVSPDNYRNQTHPWNADLDQYLEEVWNFKSGSDKVAALYEIKV